MSFMSRTTIRRSTKQRTIVFEIVAHAKSHPSAEEVFTIARKKLPDISLATVYRNLHLLAEEGKIREVQFEGSTLRYDGMTMEHEHFCCRSCGNVQDLPVSLPTSSLTSIQTRLGVTVERYSLDYYGLCNKCTTR
jgi:Fe2+ or Zn2+ uptake regulation protein